MIRYLTRPEFGNFSRSFPAQYSLQTGAFL